MYRKIFKLGFAVNLLVCLLILFASHNQALFHSNVINMSFKILSYAQAGLADPSYGSVWKFKSYLSRTSRLTVLLAPQPRRVTLAQHRIRKTLVRLIDSDQIDDFSKEPTTNGSSFRCAGAVSAFPLWPNAWMYVLLPAVGWTLLPLLLQQVMNTSIDVVQRQGYLLALLISKRAYLYCLALASTTAAAYRAAADEPLPLGKVSLTPNFLPPTLCYFICASPLLV